MLKRWNFLKTGFYERINVGEGVKGSATSSPRVSHWLTIMFTVDETLIGGKTRGKGRAYKGNKTWVAGAIQRGGGIRLKRIDDVRKHTLTSASY